MHATIKPEWSNPSTILFASKSPADKKIFLFALAQAIESSAELILFHAYDTLGEEAQQVSGTRAYDYAAAACSESQHFEPLVRQIRDAGLSCETIVRPGPAAHEIVAFLREREIDRVVMGSNSRGGIGKLLVGSVAEAVMRIAKVPVCIIGSGVAEDAHRTLARGTILCAVSRSESSRFVVRFSAELAAHRGARLILHHVILPKARAHALAPHDLAQIESNLYSMVPAELRSKLDVQSIVAPGDTAEEILNQSRVQSSNLIVVGAQSTSSFSAVAHPGVAYKVMTRAHCPVIALGIS